MLQFSIHLKLGLGILSRNNEEPRRDKREKKYYWILIRVSPERSIVKMTDVRSLSEKLLSDCVNLDEESNV